MNHINIARGKVKPFSLCLIAALVGLFILLPTRVAAGTLTSRSATLETSAFSTASKIIFKFTLATLLTGDGTGGTADFSFKFNFPTDAGGDPFTIPAFVAGDASISVASCSTASITVIDVVEANDGGAVANDSVLVTADRGTTVDPPIGCQVTLTLGTGATKVTTPANNAAGCTANAAGTADTCEIILATTESTANPITAVDSGDVLVGFIEGVSVSATVDESLSFSMTQGAACAGDTGSPTSINASVTATTVPFGSVNADTFYVGCHDLTITTNGSNGYNVTGEENTNLRTSGGTNLIDTTCDPGTCNETTGQAWATATANHGFGYTCENVTSTPCAAGGDSFIEYRQFACRGTDAECDPSSTGNETAQNIMTKSSSASGDKGRIHYKLSRPVSQIAGTYSNTVRYIATGNF